MPISTIVFLFLFFIFRFPDSSLDYYTITVNLIHKKVVCFNSWTISIRVQQSLTTMDYLCRHVSLYFLLDVGTYLYFDFFNLLVLFYCMLLLKKDTLQFTIIFFKFTNTIYTVSKSAKGRNSSGMDITYII